LGSWLRKSKPRPHKTPQAFFLIKWPHAAFAASAPRRPWVRLPPLRPKYRIRLMAEPVFFVWVVGYGSRSYGLIKRRRRFFNKMAACGRSRRLRRGGRGFDSRHSDQIISIVMIPSVLKLPCFFHVFKFSKPSSSFYHTVIACSLWP